MSGIRVCSFLNRSNVCKMALSTSNLRLQLSSVCFLRKFLKPYSNLGLQLSSGCFLCSVYTILGMMILSELQIRTIGIYQFSALLYILKLLTFS